MSSDAVFCANGEVCPAGTQCDDVNGGCIVADQIGACSELAADAACSWDDNAGICTNGVCLSHSCGDGRRSGPEQCDGSSDVSASTCVELGYYEEAGVECAADCTWQLTRCSTFCGDGVVNGPELCEPGMPPPQSCVDYGYDRGTLGCGACAPSFVECGEIRWARRAFGYLPHGADVVGDVLVAAIEDSVTGHVAARYTGAGWVGLGAPATPGGLAQANDVAVVSATDIWAGGAISNGGGGYVARYDGSAWTIAKSFTFPINRVWASATHVFAIENTTLHRYDGATWTSHTLSPNVAGVSIAARSADDVWVTSGKLYHVDAAGAVAEVALPAGTNEPSGPFVLADGTLLLGARNTATSRMELHARRNGAWTTTIPFAEPDMESVQIYATSLADIYVLFSGTRLGNGTAFVAHYDGMRWSVLSNEQYHFYPTVLTGSASVGVVALDFYTRTSQHYRGSVWLRHDGPVAAFSYYGVSGPERDELFVTGVNPSSFPPIERIYRFDGVRWSSSPEVAQGIVDSSGGVTYALDRDSVRVWRRTGSSWTQTALPIAVDSDATRPFAVREANAIYLTIRSTGPSYVAFWNGTSVVATNIPASTGILGIDCGSSGCWAYSDVTLWKTPGAPTEWTQVTDSGLSQFRGVWVAPDGDVFVGGGAGVVAHLRSGTWQTTQLRAFENVVAFAGSASNDVFAMTREVDGGAALHHYDGTVWEPIRAPYDSFTRHVSAFGAAGDRLHIFSRVPSVDGPDDPPFELVRTQPW